jgi:O-methyltransferase involved in polyketide biosynthesis
MSRSNIGDLSDVSETLLIPLYLRAAESKRPDALLKDEKAIELINQIDYDFSGFKGLSFDQVTILMRARELDRCARVFLAQHPGAVVVDMGCGLDTRFYRVGDQMVQWYDLDLPEVISLRRRLLPETPRCQFIASSVLDLRWMDLVAAEEGQPTLLLAEGVFPYLEETDVKRLVLALKARFPGAELAFDALSPFAAWVHNLHPALKKAAACFRWSLRDDRALEEWSTEIRLLGVWHYFDEPEPRLGWSKLLRFFPPIGKGARILRYRLGEPGEAAREARSNENAGGLVSNGGAVFGLV